MSLQKNNLSSHVKVVLSLFCHNKICIVKKKQNSANKKMTKSIPTLCFLSLPPLPPSLFPGIFRTAEVDISDSTEKGPEEQGGQDHSPGSSGDRPVAQEKMLPLLITKDNTSVGCAMTKRRDSVLRGAGGTGRRAGRGQAPSAWLVIECGTWTHPWRSFTWPGACVLKSVQISGSYSGNRLPISLERGVWL